MKRLIGKLIYKLNPRLALLIQGFIKKVNVNITGRKIILGGIDKKVIINIKNKVYGFDIINDFDYYFYSVESTKSKNLFIVDFSEEKKHRLANSKLDFIFPSLPESEQSTEAYIGALKLMPGEVVLDLGSYAGVSSYFMSKEVGSNGKVICVEPDPTNFAVLKKNIDNHKITNSILINKGIWTSSGKISFQSEGNLGSKVSDHSSRKNNKISIDVITLDELQLEIGLRINAIKMDIEGVESDVLKSAYHFLVNNNYPRLVIEPHLINGISNVHNLCDTLSSYGYTTNLISQSENQSPLIHAFYN
jgi:FkbM family methyltransferase